MPAGSTMAKIPQRGRLIAGVSADTYLLGSRNPFNGRIEGFDIDLVKAIAKAIFGNENAYELRVITAAQRIPALQEGSVDIVARNMTINCERWKQIAFSSEYYRSGQKILVRRGSKVDHHRRPGRAARLRARTAPRAWTTSRSGRRRPSPSAPTATPDAWCCSRRATSTPSPATTRCWPVWPPRIRTPSCPSRRRSPPSRTGSG